MHIFVRLTLALLVSLSLVGCNSKVSSIPGAAPAVTGAPSPTSLEESNSECMRQAPTLPAGTKRVLVKRVIDGDTIELSDTTRVRLIGIDTPESVDPRRPVEALGKEASAYTKQMLEGKEVLMQPGQTPIDRYGRSLAWLWMLDGTFVNAKLVLDGYAAVYTFSDNPDYAVLLTQCQSEASNAKRGLWAPGVQSDHTGTALPSETLTVLRSPGEVNKGDLASITVKTAPLTDCSLVVQYKSGPSRAKGLEPKTADSNGAAAWSWRVGTNTASGTYPITVTCGTLTAVAELTVQ